VVEEEEEIVIMLMWEQVVAVPVGLGLQLVCQ
jgi:hypothetical protein